MARLKKYEATAFCILFLVVLATAASNSDMVTSPGTTTNSSDYSTTFFIPSAHSIHSDQINDMINGYNGSVIIGTSFGLSTFSGMWSTRHINRDNFSEGLHDNFITAVEMDKSGNLWIGYSGGVQIFNGNTYQTIRDQQLFKDPRVTDLQRWNDDMWVATGNAGLHRYRDGIWTWFQPGVKNGAPFFTVTAMALDTTGNTSLVIATHDEGLWLLRSAGDPVHFERLDAGESIIDPLRQVRSDPYGGVYLFNGSMVMHYAVGSGFMHVLSNSDLSYSPIKINDISGATDGTLYLATDNGIYVWRDGGIYRRISSFDGIGPTNIVKFIFVDNEVRVWYASQGYVGYIRENTGEGSLIPIQVVIPTTTPAPLEKYDINESPQQPVLTPFPAGATPDSFQEIFSAIIDPILRAINAVASRLGLKF
jgi:hypothetical protein